MGGGLVITPWGYVAICGPSETRQTQTNGDSNDDSNNSNVDHQHWRRTTFSELEQPFMSSNLPNKTAVQLSRTSVQPSWTPQRTRRTPFRSTEHLILNAIGLNPNLYFPLPPSHPKYWGHRSSIPVSVSCQSGWWCFYGRKNTKLSFWQLSTKPFCFVNRTRLLFLQKLDWEAIRSYFGGDC